MLKLLLDEHISRQIARQLRTHQSEISVASVLEWHAGQFLGASDAELLAAAHAERLTLVTYDQQTIRPLLAIWASEGKDHSGLLFVSPKTIPSNNFGALVNALLALWREANEDDWTNIARYLQA